MKNLIASPTKGQTTYTAKVFDDFGGVSIETVSAVDMTEAQYAIAERLGVDPDTVWVLKAGEDATPRNPDYMEPVLDNPGYIPCNCEDYPCCEH
jgi:hypothetical protein